MTTEQALEKAKAALNCLDVDHDPERRVAAELMRAFADGLDSGLHPRHQNAERIRAEADALERGEG